MRRFDGPLIHAKTLLDRNTIGAPFKVVSVLEDPHPPPVGYSSPGILPDMAVHNIDEAIWLLGARPERASAMGANLHNFRITTVEEDFDDAFLQMAFPDNVIAQVQVSRKPRGRVSQRNVDLRPGRPHPRGAIFTKIRCG